MHRRLTAADLEEYREQGWELAMAPGRIFLVKEDGSGDKDAGTGQSILPGASTRLTPDPFDYGSVLDVDTQGKAEGGVPAAAMTDAALLCLLPEERRAAMAETILQRQNAAIAVRDATANLFQLQRVELMTQAVASAEEINSHLKRWRWLAVWAVGLLALSTLGAFLFLWQLLPLVGDRDINGAELAVLVFVLALLAASPATLLLIGRPLKGLDEWAPGKAADTPAEPKSTDTDPKKT